MEHPLKDKFDRDGYMVLELGLTDSYINALLTLLYEEIRQGVKEQDERYHYSDSPRVFEAWKTNKYVSNLAANPLILDTLRDLYGREPSPFQTINFIKGTQQPLHSDAIHFYTEPEGWLAGVWVALEDITTEQGALQIVPGSHKWPFIDFPYLDLPVPKYGEQFESYAIYEQFLIDLVSEKNAKIVSVEMKKGQALVWHGNLLHGGGPVTKEGSTRLSQANHYFFDGCDHYYSPLFSDRQKGIYAEKDLTTKDILQAARNSKESK